MKEQCCCECDPKNGVIAFGVISLFGGLNNVEHVVSALHGPPTPLIQAICNDSTFCHASFAVAALSRILFAVLALTGVYAKKTDLIKACLVLCLITTVADLFVAFVYGSAPLNTLLMSAVVQVACTIWIMSMGRSYMRNLEKEGL